MKYSVTQTCDVCVCMSVCVFVCFQAPSKASVPDGEKPQLDAAAALGAEHPRVQSDVVFNIRALQQGELAALQLHIW